jgi:hypothetical protein
VPVGKVATVVPVVVKVRELDPTVARVEELAKVRAAEVAGETVTPL